MRNLAVAVALAWAAGGSSAAVAAGTCPIAPSAPAPASLTAEIQRQNAAMTAAREAGDAERLLGLFAPDAVIMPEYQPRLFGKAEGLAFYRTFFARVRLSELSMTTRDVLPLEDGAVEWGTFQARQAIGGGEAKARAGKYMHLWRRQPDGALRLKAEVWGYAAPHEDPAAHALDGPPRPGQAAPAGEPALAAELDRHNAADARGVRDHDLGRIGIYAQDAVFLPFAESPKVGLAAIRAHLTPYIERGRGATFDRVRVWNEGFEARGAYVIEYPRFEVHWRAGDASGVSTGTGLRVWRREPDCGLKMIRQIGTHYHLAPSSAGGGGGTESQATAKSSE